MLKTFASAITLLALTAGSASTALAGGCSACTSTHGSTGAACPMTDMKSMPPAPATAKSQTNRSYSYEPGTAVAPAYRSYTAPRSRAPNYTYHKTDPRRYGVR